MKQPSIFSVTLFKKQRGSSLLELMLVIAITAVLACLSLPTYKNYLRRAALLELLQLIMPHKLESELCLLEGGTVGSASHPETSIHTGIVNGQHSFSNALVDTLSNGSLKIQGLQQLAGLRLLLTPSLVNSQLEWKADFSGCSSDLLPLVQQTFRFIHTGSANG